MPSIVDLQTLPLVCKFNGQSAWCCWNWCSIWKWQSCFTWSSI